MNVSQGRHLISLLTVSMTSVSLPAFPQSLTHAFEGQDLVVNFPSRNANERSGYSLIDMGFTQKDLYKLWVKTENPTSFPSERSLECLKDPKNWQMTAVRFVPIARSTYMPGAFQDWRVIEAKNNYNFEKVVQVRVVVRPFCQGFSASDGLVPADNALHVIYNLIPLWLKPSYKQLLQAFKNGDSQAVSEQLREIDAQLKSEEYKKYREGILSEWAGVFQWRSEKSRSQIMENLNRDFADPEQPVKSDYIHPHLSQGGSSAYGSFVINFLKKWATQQHLKDITTLLTRGGVIWNFDSFSYEGGKLRRQAKLESFRLHVRDKGALLTPVAIQGKESPEAIDRAEGVSEKEFNEREMQFQPIHGKRFAAEFKKKLLDLDVSNPTTMSCKGCHSILTNPYDGAQYDFHMLPPGKINAVTSQELLFESETLNQQYGLEVGSQDVTPDSPGPQANQCEVVEEGYANVRSPQNSSFIRFSVRTGTKLIRIPEIDKGSRIGVALIYTLPQDVTSCRDTEPSLCVQGAYVDTGKAESLGSLSAEGVFVDKKGKRIAVVADKTALTVTRATSSGVLHVKTRGTISADMCR